MPALRVTGTVIDACDRQGLEGLRVDLIFGQTQLMTAHTTTHGEFAGRIEEVPDATTELPGSQLAARVFRDNEALTVSAQRLWSSDKSLSVHLELEMQPCDDRAQPEPSAHGPLRISTYAELLEHEREILQRIEALPNGGNLFLLHPFMLLEDIEVTLSEEAKAAVLKAQPQIAGLSGVPYRALRASKSPQRFRVHLRGLFERRTA